MLMGQLSGQRLAKMLGLRLNYEEAQELDSRTIDLFGIQVE